MNDIFIGEIIDGYKISNAVGEGCIGKVYKAIHEDLLDTRAIKFIPMSKVKRVPNWQQEIRKVNQLSAVPGVVHYLTQGTYPTTGEAEYLYIMWEYVNGSSLKEIVSSKQITIQILTDVVVESLRVFHACEHLHIQHSDFHSGNILIEDPNPLYIDSNIRRVRITDFGCGTFSPAMGVPAMDDYDGLARIIQECIAVIDFHQLEAEDRHKYEVFKNKFPRYLHETNRTEGDYVRKPSELISKLYELFEFHENLQPSQKNIGDFPAAEMLGDQYNEWDALFVPKFLATEDLLDRSICVLTGLRGCGKTMMFRRLSFDLQERLGPSGILGEDTFIGFYLNARLLAEAFPWLPSNKKKDARRQIINFFNVKWCIEVLNWLRLRIKKKSEVDLSWLCVFFSHYFPHIIFTSNSSESILKTIIDECTKELARSKLDDRYLPKEDWRFSDYDFLSGFLNEVFLNSRFGVGRNVFFFLDDYSTPMINPTMQEILNPIVFRRTSNIYFKVSTESTESFISKGLNGKILENGSDYKLIDLGSELFKSAQDSKRIPEIVKAIFEKRINRSSVFNGREISLDRLLGNSNRTNNELAKQIRENDKQVYYFGADVFCNLWSSDVRELISILSEMLNSQGMDSLTKELENDNSSSIIPAKVQDSTLRNYGGRYLRLLSVTTNPNKSLPTQDETYGEHLMEIVSAFQEMVYYDIKNVDSKNEDNKPPKQARKIELKTLNGQWTENAEDYYKGLIRYGVFIQDYRAKSVRGTPAQRLYLRGLLIPYSRITFSKRDSIMMDWDGFNRFLLKPKEFAKEYISKRKETDNPINGTASEQMPTSTETPGQTVIDGFN